MSTKNSTKTLGTLGIQFGNMILTLATSLILARILKASGLGVYKYAMSWVNLLVILSLFGYDVLLIREIAIYKSMAKWDRIREVLKSSRHSILINSSIIIAIAIAINYSVPADIEKKIVFSFALLLVPLISLTRIYTGTLQGFQFVVTSQIPNLLFKPLLIFLTITVFFTLNFALTPLMVIIIRILIGTLALILSVLILKIKIPFPPSKNHIVDKKWYWSKRAFPFYMISFMYVINSQTDILMLGALKTSADVGIYGIVGRGAFLILFVLMAANKVFSPQFAKLYAQKRLDDLQNLFNKSTIMIMVGSLPIALILIFFGDRILSIFGSEFIIGYKALVILSISQLITVFLGPQSRLFVMSGFENISAFIIGSGAIVNIILNVLFIPAYGINGAALATAISSIYIKIFISIMIFRKIGIHPFLFHFIIKYRMK